MSTENNTPVEQTETNLDDFATEFFGQKEVAADPAKSDVEEKAESDAPIIEDTHTEAPEDADVDNEDNTEDVPGGADKPKKNRFQERIDELTADKMAEKRRADELAQRIADLEAKQAAPKSTPEPVAKSTDGPSPTDLNEDGTDKYPLGEFDPAYLRDFVTHLHEAKEQESKARAEEAAKQAKVEAEQAELRDNWNAKLTPAQERYPDFMDKGQRLVDSFSDLEPSYAEYLTASLMSMDNGPDVLYHLASNPEEARAIVNSGPIKAVIAMGGLNARFAISSEEVEEKKLSRPKVSQAPTPPARLNKGSSAAVETPDDTDDLDAFSAKLFRQKG
jgi:hypothetical protein